MATDTERELFARLADDASRATLDGPDVLRRRGDRRTAVGAVVGSLTAVAVVAAVVLGSGVLTDRSTAPNIVDRPTPTPSASPTAAPTGRPTSIPSTAWLNMSDRNDSSELVENEGELWRPCTDPLLAPPAAGEVSEMRFGVYRAPNLTSDYVPDGTVKQILRVADGERAQLALLAMASVATECPTGARVYPDALPDGLLIRITTMQGDTPVRSWVTAQAVGGALCVLWLQGWEGTSADEEDARRLSAAAAVRLRAWLD